MATIEEDIQTMVGGRFSPDSLGTEVYDGILARAKADAKAYLETLESHYLGLNFDAVSQSNLYLPSFLEHMVEIEPVLAHATAERLLRQYEAVLLVYDSTRDKQALLATLPEDIVRLVQRLDTKRIELRVLLKTVR